MGTRRLTIAGALLSGVLAATPVAAQADEYFTDFESPGFGAGPIGGQDGWGSVLPGTDANVVTNGPAAQGAELGAQSFQFSNAYVNGAIKQVSSPILNEGAGEAGAVGGSGTRHTWFDAGFTFATHDLAPQNGLSLHVSPDDGNGHRTASVRLRDLPAGLEISSLDVTDEGPGETATWEYVPIAVGVDRSVPHSLWFEIDYLDGPSNDVVDIYLDDELVHTTATWEQYYRNDPEHAPAGNTLPVASSLMFSAQVTYDGAAPGLAGEGLLIDDLAIATSSAAPEPPVIVDPPSPGPPKPPKPPAKPQQDDDAPKLHLAGSDGGTVVQGGFAAGKKAVSLALRCDERCTVKASGGLSLKAGGKPIKLEVVTRTLKAGSKGKIALRLSPAARRVVKRALRDGKVVKAKVVLRVKDAAGNVRLVRRTVRLRA
jgi:hypothetical protein